jgi:hypothetical protein
VGDTGIAHIANGGLTVEMTSAQGAVLSVWGSGASDVYAGASDGSILHSAGDGTWQTAYSAGAPVWAGWSGQPGDAYAVTTSSTTAKDPACQILHSRDGQSWTTESFSADPVALVGIWGSGPEDVYVCGWHIANGAVEGDPWQIRSVWGTSATNVYLGLYDVEDGPVVLNGQR